ncbi:MAG: DUF1257 domain-containing protein [Candidatus Obscuribacterales bacterium]|nr:DUF1257 domain-containing protein [Candidatus Obscuribacterales bacterium]
MSHFSKVKTKITDLELACKALADMKLSYQLGPTTLRGWEKNQKLKADLIVTLGSGSYDIGLVQSGANYDIVADWMGVKKFTEQTFSQALNQRYAYHAVVQKLHDQGFSIEQESVGEKQAIKLTMSRLA